jgi:hypothetical protein
MVVGWGTTVFWIFSLAWAWKQLNHIEKLTNIVENCEYLEGLLQTLTDYCDPWQS